MSQSSLPVVGFVVGALLGAGAVWIALDGRMDALSEQITETESALERAERDSSNWKASASAEVERNSELKARVKELERARDLASRAPVPGPHGGASGGAPQGTTPTADDPSAAGSASGQPVAPSAWDESTYRGNVELLSTKPAAARKSSLYARVLEATELRGEAGRKWLVSLLTTSVPNNCKTVAVMLLEDAGAKGLPSEGEAEVVDALVRAYVKAKDADDELLRNTLLNAIAVLPGDAAVPHLLAALADPADDRAAERAALRGLGLRRHAAAQAAARGEVKGVGKVLRYAAIGNLNIAERRSGYQSEEVRTTFEKALANLDGDAQAEVILEALGQYWSTTSVEPLRTFGESKIGSPRVRLRARKLADQIASGKPRPSAKEGTVKPMTDE